jgi:NAD(P)-dependent dehydrogenase (short-subunit alcohol dehydrogenase family)
VRDLSPYGDIAFRVADVTDEAAVAELVQATVSRFGRLDYAFNNAANTEAATGNGAFTDMRLEEFEGIVRTSLTSVWLSMKHELPAILDSGGGAIVNTSSMDAELRIAGTGSYAAAKAGCEALTVATAKEYAARGVRINAVRPGAIRTRMLGANLGPRTPPSAGT